MVRSRRAIQFAVLASGLAAGAGAARAADPYESAPAYARPAAPFVHLRPIVTVGQKVPLTGGTAGETFRLVGIPDGMGAYRKGGGLALLNIQAHSLRIVPVNETVQGGQILQLIWRPDSESVDED